MLTERQKQILSIIVDDYVRSAEPVGSRSISKRDHISYSPATIRNEMADLEDMGYLTQPHTSAGRIPSHKGYRFYVDHLMTLETLSLDVISNIKKMYAEQFVEFEQVIEQTASILSQLTNYTSIVLGPEFFDASLKHVQLLPLNETSAVAIIVTDTGHVENRKISVSPSISLSEMERLVNILNHKLKGVPLYQLRGKLYSEVANELKLHMNDYEKAMNLLEQAFSQSKEERVFLGGTTNIFSQPEFQDVKKVRDLFELLEQHDRIHYILSSNETSTTGIQVRIGRENVDQAIEDCSIITASYCIGNRPVGSLSILGPTRMEYRRVVSILNYFTQDLTFLLNRLYEKRS